MATKYTTEEKDSLIQIFEAMEVKPKVDDIESLQAWMQDYVRGQNRASNSEHLEAESKTDTVVHKTVVQPQLRIVPFSGSGGSNEVSYEAWKFEICTLLKDKTHSKSDIESAAKKSLRGEAANVIRRLGIYADISTVIDKLDGMYGVVEDSESLLSQFYNAKQLPDEKVTSWGCRLEDLLDRANKQCPLQARSFSDMLRTKFWSGLLSYLKERSRYMKDHVQDYNALLIEVRRIECESEITPSKTSITASGTFSKNDGKKSHLKAINAVDEETRHEESEMSSIKGLICKMNTRLDDMEKSLKTKSELDVKMPNSDNSFGRSNYQINQNYRGRGQNQGQTRGRGNYHGGLHGNNQHQRYGFQNSRNNNWWNRAIPVPHQPRQESDIQCYRCGQFGHIAIGCRAVLDTPSPSLNDHESA
jgi:hypothetical protein